MAKIKSTFGGIPTPTHQFARTTSTATGPATAPETSPMEKTNMKSFKMGTAIWWIPNPTKMANRMSQIQLRRQQSEQRKYSLASEFSRDFTDLIRNVSLHGYNKLMAPELHIWEKFIWLLVHIATFITLLVILSLIWEQFVAQYLVINLKDPLYPVENIPFPAVTICANNRISFQAAQAYALQLQKLSPEDKPLDFFLDGFKLLSEQYQMYVSGSDNEEEYTIFQTFLDTYGVMSNETFYNMRRNMYYLTPTCSDFLVNCSISGVQIPCMSSTTFKPKFTTYGACCSYNNTQSLLGKLLVGAELGMEVTVNSSSADDHATIFNINGYTVLLHSPNDFADIFSGGTRQIFIPHGVQSYLQISPRLIYADKSIKTFSPKSRKCIFPDESNSPNFDNNLAYSFSNCLTSCRIRSMLALCRCIPYFMPLDLLERADGLVYCTLTHLTCLKRYSFKWKNILTERGHAGGLEREMEDALYCPECLPTCNDIQYRISLLTLPMNLEWWKEEKNAIESTAPVNRNISILHIYFAKFTAPLYMRVLGNTWVEAVSTVGNIVSIFMGFSVAAMLEIVYFIVKHVILSIRQLLTKFSHHEDVAPKDPEEPTKLIIFP